MPLVRRQRSQRAGEDRIESTCAVRGLACLVADQLGSEQWVTAGRGHDLIGELVATLRREFRGHLGDQLSNVVGGQVVQPDLTDEVDSFELGAQPTGSRMAVEWARGDDPVHVGDGPAHHVLQCRHGGRVERLNVIEGDGEVTFRRGLPKACHDPVGDTRPPRFAVPVRVWPAKGIDHRCGCARHHVSGRGEERRDEAAAAVERSSRAGDVQQHGRRRIGSIGDLSEQSRLPGAWSPLDPYHPARTQHLRERCVTSDHRVTASGERGGPRRVACSLTRSAGAPPRQARGRASSRTRRARVEPRSRRAAPRCGDRHSTARAPTVATEPHGAAARWRPAGDGGRRRHSVDPRAIVRPTAPRRWPVARRSPRQWTSPIPRRPPRGAGDREPAPAPDQWSTRQPPGPGRAPGLLWTAAWKRSRSSPHAPRR